MKQGSLIVFLLIAISILFIAGFYTILNNIADLENELKSLEITLQYNNPLIKDEADTKNPLVNTSTIPTTPKPNPTESQDKISIPTAITFNVLSNPLLQPQTNVSVLIENVSKNKDGETTVSIKAFTNEANSYSTIEPRDFFELINLEDTNQKPLKVTGSFQPMPPKAVTEGTIIFKIKPEQQTIILQIRPNENEIKNYEFNFGTKTYSETILG